MYIRTGVRFVVLAMVLLAGAATQGLAQGTMVRPTPPTPSRDSNGDLKADQSASSGEATARGVVALADGSVSEELVEIYSVCGGVQKFIAVADSKGRFSFNSAVLSDIKDPKVCVLRASLEGYRSETKPLAEVSMSSATKLGKIVLQPLSSDTNGLISTADAQASKNAKKAYEKGFDEAAKQDWASAMASMQKALAAYPGYSSAWLTLGILQESGGDRESAQKSFAESARLDAKFADPFIRIAALAGARADWQAALDSSQKAIDINPTAFPHAYELNAIASLNLHKHDVAEKSATEGLKLDTEHRYPDLEYVMGMILKIKNDREGAMKHLQAYVDHAPAGTHAASAKMELTQLQAAH
jgi:Flp pilus assembly protein TadD